MSKEKFVTVVYEIMDEEEWAKNNPLGFSHHGLTARAASMGDVLEKIEKTDKMEEVVSAARIESEEHIDGCRCCLCLSLKNLDTFAVQGEDR